ncbi:subtilisin-like serine protease QhpE [Marinobacterium sedimentorum]|uniref:subtilisin-like serine protease QhpE n=1 Tax=Marinobacterium sedimentorum TaxID=2927804 RepID=UPI0020C6781E|nr:S8 family serine peptidase [Marinobacterium sedimentorum]MCP8686473.1 S8 family serine peptidase [Marinobacterium sedimentorum]
MAKALRVGIVDSGANERMQLSVEAAAGFVIEQQQLWQTEGVDDRLGHGSMVLDIIHELAPDARFALAQVFHDRFSTTAVQVAAAIDWLVEQQVAIINLSLGLRQDRPVLREACERALSAGVLLCAASPARGEPVYPSTYPGVFRMTGDARCARDEICHLETEFADFGGHVRPLDGALGASGASMGCAHMTGHLARYLSEGGQGGLAAARHWLIQQSSYQGPEQRR